MTRAPHRRRRPIPRGLYAALVAAALPVHAATEALELPLEDLLQVRIISTPKFSENPDRIPSAVSILTQADIRTYGWRTLGDALRTLPGFNVTDDHTYRYAGVRGISPVGDFRARMQVLIDGVSINENIYASAAVDSALPLDLGLIERIEVIRGPSASIYGSDSLFGVINVVTRSGASLAGTEIALAGGSGAERQGRASWGGQVAGTDVLVSATGFKAGGRSLAFGDLGAPGDNVQVNGLGAEQGGKLFLRARGADWRFTLLHSRRDRSVPTGSYGTIPDDRGHREIDRYSLIDLSKDWQLAPKLRLQQRLFVGEYGYDGKFPYDYSPDDPYLVNVDQARGRWWGLENRVVSTARAGHRFTVGIEYRANSRQDQLNYDRGYGCFGVSSAPCLDDRRRSEQLTLLAEDEIELSAADTLIAGLRYDKTGAAWSPRLGLIHDADDAGLFKLLFGTAFRLPSPYEKAYITPTFIYGNPELTPEKMKSLELTWEKQLSPHSRLVATAYAYRIDHLIGSDATGVVDNGSRVHARGIELEFERHWLNGARWRSSLANQHAADAAGRLDNSPRTMAKFNLALPTGIGGLGLGLEGQWIGARQSGMGTHRVGSYALANVNFRYAPDGERWEAGLGLYNLFDRRYHDPVSPDTTATGIARSELPQLGRSLQLRTLIRF